MQFQDISDLPPLAIIAFGISLGILYFVTKGGFASGQKVNPASAPSSAQVAAVIVDPTALNKATAALEAQTMENINGRKSFERGIEALCRSVERLCEEVDDLKKEMIRKGH
ncbi:hypothetical protein [Rhizobium sp. Root482]|uniref:hypothetical protein n=1 Tax=Rhizobium sp. Root482 TaxID=1736543 RepID=UPI0006FF7EC5|nr:hypothetical protein [Rhizobium sp. Root482]KQY27164.1 hypothetical protein ASD31_02985 [Rhizobium sp. Root482]